MRSHRSGLAASLIAALFVTTVAWGPADAGGGPGVQQSGASAEAVTAWTEGPDFVPASSASDRLFLWSVDADPLDDLDESVDCGSGSVIEIGDWLVEGVHTLRCRFGAAGTTSVGVRVSDADGVVADGRKTVRITSQVASVADGRLVIDGPDDDQFGGAIAAPDLNGDGKADIAIGGTAITTASDPGSDPGYVAVVFGRSAAGAIDLAALPDGAGFRIIGPDGVEGFGRSLASAGDVNDDGLDDLVIGSVGGSDGDGVVYVVFGSMSSADVDVESLTPERGAVIAGPDMAGLRGTTLAGIGDTNGDGIDDITIGTPGFDGGEGRVDVLFGASEFTDIDLAALSEERGFHIDGPGLGTGLSVAGADINGDGLADIVAGAGLGANDNAVVVYGTTAPGDVDAATMSADQGFQIGGDESLGITAVAAGDMNGDGFAEVIVAHPSWNDGGSWDISIVRGAATNASIPSVAGASASRLIRINAPGEELGRSLTTLDWNGDKRADLLVGGPYEQNNGEGSGSAYLVKGSTTLKPLDLGALDPHWFRVDGDTWFAFAGAGVAGGDVTGDGIDDILVGAPGQFTWDGDTQPGRVALFRGSRSDTKAPTVTAPRQAIRVGQALVGGKPIVRLAWNGSDAGSGIDHYVVARRTNEGAWVKIATPTADRLDVALAPGKAYRFRVRAIDEAGNRSGWNYGSTFRLGTIPDTSSRVTYRKTWRTAAGEGYLGGSAHYATTTGASATLTFTGRQVALVAPVGSSRGSARVYVNGRFVGKVSLNADTNRPTRVVARWSWSSVATRTISFRVVGTTGHPRVDVDAFVVLR